MQGSEQWNISPHQVTWLIAMTIMGDGIFFLPSVSALAARQDAWISFALATVTGLGFAWLVVTLGKRFPNQTIVQYSRTIAGSWIGSLLGLFFVTYFLLTTSFMTREFGEFLTTMIMPDTPISLFMIVLILLCSYALRNGLEVLGRIVEFLFPLYFLFIIVTIAIVLPELSLVNLTPVLNNSTGSIVNGMIGPTAWMAEVSIMLAMLPHLNDQTKAFKVSIIGVLTAGALMTMAEVGILATFGPDMTAHFQFPFFDLIRYEAPAAFAERVDAVAMVFWIFGDFIRTGVFFFVAANGMAQWLNLTDYRPLLAPMAIIIISLAVTQFDNINDIHTFGGGLYTFYALSMKIGIPLLLLVWAAITGIKEKKFP